MRRREKTVIRIPAILLALACLCAEPVAQSRVDAASGPFSAAPYRVGERLTYNVSFSNFPTAAHVELFVAGQGQFFGREGVELRAHVETTGIVSAALYALNNDYVTHVDPATGFPYRAQQIVREGTRVSETTRDFNAGPVPSPVAEGASSTPGAFDFVSALYRLRALPLAPGTTYALTVRGDDATVYQAEVRVTGRELVKTNVGSSNTVVAQVRVRGNPALDDRRLQVYFTDDARHVPALITVKLAAGEIRAELASAELITIPPPEPVVGDPAAAQPDPGLPPQPGGDARPAVPQPGRTPAPPAGAGAAVAVSPPGALPFAVGEQLNFNFFLGNGAQPIGTASLHVRARQRFFNRDGFLLAAVMQTTGAGQQLFPVNDQINSYVEAGTLLPFRSQLNLIEGPRRARLVVSLDQNSGSALFDDGARVEIQAGTHDLVSVLYALRSFDLTPPKRTAVSLLVNKRPRPLFITALRRETIALGGQQIPAVELSLTTGEAHDKYNLRLWVSTDRRRLPLRLTAQTPLGPVRADLAIIPTTLQ